MLLEMLNTTCSVVNFVLGRMHWSSTEKSRDQNGLKRRRVNNRQQDEREIDRNGAFAARHLHAKAGSEHDQKKINKEVRPIVTRNLERDHNARQCEQDNCSQQEFHFCRALRSHRVFPGHPGILLDLCLK